MNGRAAVRRNGEDMEKVKFKKKLENYWYYYKVHTIIGIILLIIVAAIVHDVLSVVTPDVTIVIDTQFPSVYQGDQDAMQKYLSKYTEDVNHDGKKYVECNFGSVDNDQNMQLAQVILGGNLGSNRNIIYIFDDYTVAKLLPNQVTTTFSKVNSVFPNVKDGDTYKLSVSKTTLSKQSFARSLKGTSIYIKNYSTANNDKKTKAYIQNELNVLKAILSTQS